MQEKIKIKYLALVRAAKQYEVANRLSLPRPLAIAAQRTDIKALLGKLPSAGGCA